MTGKLIDKDNKLLDYEVETEYIGNEETEYIDDEQTEYINEYETKYQMTENDELFKSNVLNNRYKILNIVGKGGMGAVYKAIDLRLRNSLVAIKEIDLDTIENENIERSIENFENEAATLITLRHDAIPRVMDFFSLNNDKCYIVMDFIDGITLEEVIKQRGPILESNVREWFYQLCDVLEYLHSRDPKVIFRDIKPSNVMLTKENKIKLIDFGIARTFKEDKFKDTTYYVSQDFSPPEQYGTGQSDERSDIYSLGALLYSLLIGGRPQIKDFKFKSLKGIVDISDELNNAIMQATEFRPENRPSSISEFRNLVEFSNSTKPKTKTGNKNKYIAIGALASSLVILGGVFINYNTSNKNEKNKEIQQSNIAGEKIELVHSNTIKDPVESEIIRAMDEVYTETEDDRNLVKYEYNKNDNYVMEDFIKEKYYIFKVHKLDEKGYIVSTDPFNYLVNKQTFTVHVYYAGGQLCWYEKGFEPYQNEEDKKYYYKMNPNIKRAYDSISKVIKHDGDYKWEYNPEIKSIEYDANEYYGFYEHSLDLNGEISTSGDYVLLVHKKTLEVYYYSSGESREDRLIKYTDYIKQNEEWLKNYSSKEDDFETGWFDGFAYGSDGGENREEILNELVLNLQGYSEDYIEGFKGGFGKGYGEWERFSEDSPTSEYYTGN